MNFVAVVDGATPLGGGEQAALRTHLFAHAIVASLTSLVPRPEDLLQAVESALRSAQQTCGVYGTTATLSCAAWDAETIRVVSLGDSSILLEKDGAVTHIQDPAFKGRELGFLTSVSDLLSEDAPAEYAYTRIEPALKSDREKRNTENGVWVLSDSHDPELVVSHADVQNFPRDGYRTIAAATDGAVAFSETFGILSLPELVAATRQGFADEIADEAREIEQNDPQRVRYPRLSPFDDATIVVADLEYGAS